jgi:hypothetical protein
MIPAAYDPAEALALEGGHMETFLQFVPITIMLVLTVIPSVRLLRRTGLHVALVALNIVPLIGTAVLIWIIAYSNWPNTQGAKSSNVAPIEFPSPRYEAGAAARPKTIVCFEWIIFGTLLVGVLQTYLTWDQVIAQAATLDHNTAVAFILAVIIFAYVLIGTLTLLVSRRRSKIAMWVSIVLYAIGLYALVESVSHEQVGSALIMTALGEIARGAAYSLLFTPSARRWMSRKDEKNEKLREVFE